MCRDTPYELLISFREKFKHVVFVYVSDDLKWGKEEVGKKARNRNFEIYFVGENSNADQRKFDRDRYLYAR